MTTREKILAEALTLFNIHGTDTVTVRHIAKEVGISHGNLCYHFPNTEEIIFKLYENLVAELSEQISRLPVEEIDLWRLYRTGRVAFSLLHKYKFMMLDFVGIMRRNDRIRIHYRQLVEYRKLEFTKTIQYLVSGGYIRPEVRDGHYKDLIEVHFLLGDFWVSRAEIILDGSEKEKLNYYLSLMFIPLMGCFTEKGLLQYEEIRKELIPEKL